MNNNLYNIYYELAYKLAGKYFLLDTINKRWRLFKKQRLQLAIILYSKCYEVNPNKNAPILFIAKCYQALGNHVMALEYLKKAWETASYNNTLFKEIETECCFLGRHEEGLQYALKSVSEYPNDAGFHAQLAIFLLLLKRIEDAYKTIEKAKSLDRNDKFVNGVYKYIVDVRSGKKQIPDKLPLNGRFP